MRIMLVIVTLAIVLPWHIKPAVQQEAIPFVGCPADVQGEDVPPPQGKPKVVALDAPTAREIAYYQGGDNPGVFAPRGWHCRAWAGSAGGSMIVSSASVDSASLEARVRGRAVEMHFLDGGTSGRFPLAKYASRLFPKIAAAFIERVKSESIAPPSDFERGPYTTDSVRYLDTFVAEFTTPANTIGLGTEGDLAPSQDPIRGVVVMSDAYTTEPGMSIIRVRLGPSMGRVASAILRLNTECMRKSGSC